MSNPSESKSLVELLREFSLPLIAGVLVALVWANLAPHSYHELIHHKIVGRIDLHFISNDIFMVMFFGIAAVEIMLSVLPGGDLNPPSKAVSPLFAMVGGVLGPIACFFGLNAIMGSAELARGWGIPTATDIALAWVVARLAFGQSHPAVPFLLLLAVGDDAVGLVIIAVFYPDPSAPVKPVALLLVGVGMLIAWALRKRRVNNYWPYLLLAGSCTWAGLFLSNLHPALALVFVIPFMPHRVYGPDETAFDLAPDDHSALGQFEHQWKIIVDFGMFLFGFANAGVEFSAVGPITWIVLLSLFIGKTLGIFGFGMIAHAMGFPLPTGIRTRELMLTGMIAGIGLTVALFVSTNAFPSGDLQGAAKMGALLSGMIAFPVLILARVMKVKRGNVGG